MNLNLTLEALKFANVSTFSRTFGTKKTGAQNGGSLTTEEFNIANALPFDKMRPIELTENSTTGYVEYDANLVINSANITLTLNSGTYKGVRVKVFAQTAGNVVHDSTVTDALLAGERAIYEWNGTTWDYVGGTPLGQLNYTTMCSTALATAKAATIKGFTLKDATTVDVYFTNGHYAANSSDAFTLNINGLGAKKIYVCKDGVQTLMQSHSITRSESGDSTAHYWYIQPNTTLKLMYISTLDSNNGGFVVIGNPIVLSGTGYTIYADGYNEVDIYSTSEVKTNKVWIDGKPIYRVVRHILHNGSFTQGYSLNGHYVNGVFTTNCDRVTQIYNVIEGQTGTKSVQYPAGWDSFSGLSWISDNQIYIVVGGSITMKEEFIVIEYTKTNA